MSNPFLTLRRLLAIDAATCAAMGLLLVSAADFVGALTRIPTPLLFWAGLALLPVAGFMAVVARMAPMPVWAINVIILGNALWVLISIVLPLSGMISPNLLGWLFLLGQAAVVAVLTHLERGASPVAANI